jgi:ribonuclease P protein component
MSNWQKNTAKLGRLKKRQEFKDTQLRGKSWVSSCVIVQFYPKLDAKQGCRVGYTVSKKVSKLAVERNRIKRRLRAAVDDVFPDTARNNTDYVLIGRDKALLADYDAIRKDLKWCLKRLHHNEALEKKTASTTSEKGA